MSYLHFCQQLPSEPASLSGALRELFKPNSEPDFADHGAGLAGFLVWLTAPPASGGAFPPDAKDPGKASGVWVAGCCILWFGRYDDHRMRAERSKSIVSRLLGTSFIGALGAGGIDGEFDGVEDVAGPVVTGCGRVVLPSLSESRRDLAIRNRDWINKIAAHYGVNL